MAAIKCKDLDRIDFAGIADRGRLAEVHPGRILLDDFRVPLGITQYRICKVFDVS
jgi:hypothetical protein